MCILIWIGRKRPVTCTIMGGAVVDWPVSIAMEKAGFKDSFREMNPDPVASPGVTWLADADSLETECRMDRIDFIYYQGKPFKR